VVDGVIAHEGIGGPAFGTPKRCDLLVAGLNSVAVDACCAKIMGFRPRTIRHLKLCAKCGLGPLDYHLDTELRGFSYRNYSFKFQSTFCGICCAQERGWQHERSSPRGRDWLRRSSTARSYSRLALAP
jgi:hypothetical protein